MGNWKYIPTQPAQLYDLAADLGETNNLAASMPEKVADMKALLEKLITDGRSTPGEPQKNDVEVVRFPKPTAPKTKAGMKAK
jgi:arylsulfatase A-like enzyme